MQGRPVRCRARAKSPAAFPVRYSAGPVPWLPSCGQQRTRPIPFPVNPGGEQLLLLVAQRRGGLGILLTCGAKGTRTPGLLDANQIFGVFLRRLASPDEAPTCADRRRVSAHV